ncbi:SpoIIE family protein phosphatase [Methanobacterium alcaliphilum]|uniref:SpoIIE family protein phosphatase n=1 Tax=Methanobacterium alcaliphilum TaxID=392018 RepID=UPI00200B0970|nr:PP2C family protein-serine/threonine phosphatase [Methanobacterium alcaliphilum]MCK9150619.1 PP2C family protein-serine/threonine phosphatase [Methanobacterium alcaliphilum]
MNNSTSIQSKATKLIICSVIVFATKFIFHYFYPALSISELGPASALPPIFGLMFGAWGAAGSAFGFLAADIMAGRPPEIYIINFFIQFLYAYIPYKLWYTLDIGEISLPRLDTVKHLLKFVIIMFITATVMSAFLGFLMDGLGLYDLVSLTTVVFAFNNFDFSIMFGSLIIIAANYYGFVMYKPKTNKNPLIPPKVFDVVVVVAIIIAIFNIIYSGLEEPTIWSMIAGTVTYSLAFIYLLKPITKEIKEKSTEIKISLTERLIIIFIITGMLIALVTGIRALYTISILGMGKLHYWESIYLSITLVLSIFYISSLGFLAYMEKNITIPIESISHIAKNYISDSNGLTNDNQIISKFDEYSADESEVGILALSFQKMIKDLKVYIKNLEKVTAEKERINAELNVAQKIQADMLPKNFSTFSNSNQFDIYATNIPAKEVGGDFYDFFMVDDNHLAIVIADVSGKGVPAALFMVIAKTLIKNYTQLGKTPEDVFNTVNNQLYEGNDENMFVTAWMGILDIETGKFTYINAGHNPPLLKTGINEYKWLKSKPGFVLAGMENIKYTQNEITINSGDRVFLYTDGITEAINCDDELFGESRLLKVLSSEKDQSLKEILNYVKKEIDIFVEGRKQFDDITMLIMEYKK